MRESFSKSIGGLMVSVIGRSVSVHINADGVKPFSIVLSERQASELGAAISHAAKVVNRMHA